MTRSAAVTVRRPGRAGTRDQHQNVAPDRGGEVAGKGCIQPASTAGTLVGMAHAFPRVVAPRRHVRRGGPMAGVDAMRERIAAHPWPRGGVEVIRANRGYTLYSRRTGGPVARLRPTGKATTCRSCGGGARPGPRRETSAPHAAAR